MAPGVLELSAHCRREGGGYGDSSGGCLPVQTTEQPPTDMAAAAAGDYCEPIALRQLQTSTEPGNHQ